MLIVNTDRSCCTFYENYKIFVCKYFLIKYLIQNNHKYKIGLNFNAIMGAIRFNKARVKWGVKPVPTTVGSK